MSESSRVVSVEVQGLRFPIRSALDEDYIAELATYVDDKMRAASDASPSGDVVKIAVVAALNIADEYFRARDGDDRAVASAEARADAIESIIDSMIAALRTEAPPLR